MTNRVDAREETPKPPRFEPAPDLARADRKLQKLPPGNDPVLTGSKPCNGLIRPFGPMHVDSLPV